MSIDYGYRDAQRRQYPRLALVSTVDMLVAELGGQDLDDIARLAGLDPWGTAVFCAQMASAGRPRDSLVFTAPEGGPVTDGHFRNWVWYPAITAAGIRRFPPRIMRHIAASWLVQDGVPLYDVQALLGHEDYATTSGTRTSRLTHTARSWNPGRAVLTHQ